MDAIKLYLPKTWTELTPKQLGLIGTLLTMGYEREEFLLKAFLLLTGLKMSATDKHSDGVFWFVHESLTKPFAIEVDLLSTMMLECEFLFQTDEINPPPRLRGCRAKHYRLYNAIFEEYLMAENYFFAYTQTQEEKYLDCLIAVLYRGFWQRWNTDKIEKRAKRFRYVGPGKKMIVFLWYVGFRSYVPKRCKTLFNGDGGGSGFNVRDYINGLIHSLTNGNIAIKSEILQSPVWDALDELEQRAQIAEKQQPKKE